MQHQDWKPVVLRKNEKPSKNDVPNIERNKKFTKLDSNDPDAPKTIRMSASNQIQKMRCTKKMSQKQLAQAINERPQVISDYESGKAIPNRSVLNKINKVLGIRVV
jgi:putative transcription factor